jgi:MFS family permease
LTIARLALALFAIQAGFHGYTASLPLALSRAGVDDPQIGLIMGTAALVQVPASLFGGRLVDRYGGVRLFTFGALVYLLATSIIILPGVEPGGPAWPFFAARILQGIGIAATLPAALSLVPRMVPRERHGIGLAFVGSAHNLTLVVLPTLSIIVLDAWSLHGVGVLVTVFVAAGLVLSRRLPLRPVIRDAGDDAKGLASRRFGITFRRAWAVPLAVILTYVAHWGVVTAYLPTRAEAYGADIGLFFAADGIAIFLMRIPTGWFTDRVQTRWLVLAGAGATALGMGLLLPPPTTPILIVAGFLGGAGGAFVMTPMLVEISRRSTDADRGSAFALFSGSLAAALTLGSIGAAPVIALASFEVALAAGLVLILVAMGLTLADRSMARVATAEEPARAA